MKLNENRNVDYSACPLPPTRILAHSHREAGEPECQDITREILLDVLRDNEIPAFVLFSERAERVTRHTVMLGESLTDVAGLEKKLRDALPYDRLYKSARIVPDQPRKDMAYFELANYADTTVPLRELITSDLFRGRKGKRAFAVGKDLSGRHVFTGFELFPNTLVAGDAGTGKSTALNTMLLSLLYRHRPDRLRILFITEPSDILAEYYTDLPHLLAPVITDARSALAALEWVSDEIGRRLTRFRARMLRGIDAYNDEVENEMIAGEIMPRIVIAIDELGGIIEEDTEKANHLITRILTYSHATGIYLIATTRRASDKLLSPEILSRIPTRIACRLSSGEASSLMIGDDSATKLIGWGDMIYSTLNNAVAERLQGAYASGKETSRVTGYVKRHYPTVRYNRELLSALRKAARPSSRTPDGAYIPPAEDYHLAFSSELDTYCRSPLFCEAVSFVVRFETVSVPMLRDHLDSSLYEAKHLIEVMRNLDILEPTERNGIYKILITRELWDSVSENHKS
jgi:S-DNA-T family DNA segregation ATPase FtsK/SpoIIIE